TFSNPPGLYGSEEGFVAHNLLKPDAELLALRQPASPVPVTQAGYAFDSAQPMKGTLMAIALGLLALDTLAMLWLSGVANKLRLRRMRRAATTVLLAITLAGAALPVDHLRAQEASPAQRVSDAEAIEAITATRIAYV